MAEEKKNKFRFPTQLTIKARDSSVNKDSLVVNGFVEETKSGQKFTIKRPGIIVEAQGAGTALGLFGYNNNLYQWYSGLGNTTPIVLHFYPGLWSPWGAWSSSTTYAITDNPVVALDPADGTYKVFYPFIPGTNVPPSTVSGSPGSAYWHTSPNVSGHTYVGQITQNGAAPGSICGSPFAAGYSAWLQQIIAFPSYGASGCVVVPTHTSYSVWYQYLSGVVAGTNAITVYTYLDSNSIPTGSCSAAPGVSTYTFTSYITQL